MTSKGKKLTRTFFLELSLLDVDAGVAGLGCQGRLIDSAVNGPVPARSGLAWNLP
jgi:hypothetical protein